MSAENLVAKYIKNTGHVFKEISVFSGETGLNEKKIREVVDYARNYFEDTKYHFDRKQFGVALASVAYCEGLLDALRLLGLAEFQWPTNL